MAGGPGASGTSGTGAAEGPGNSSPGVTGGPCSSGVEVAGGPGNCIAEATDDSGSSAAGGWGGWGSSGHSSALVADGSAVSGGTSAGGSGNRRSSVSEDSGISIAVDVLGSGCTSIGVCDETIRVSDGSSTFATGGSNMVFDGSGDVHSKGLSTDCIGYSADIVTTGSGDVSTAAVVDTGAAGKESRIFVMGGSRATATDCSDCTDMTDVDATDSSAVLAAGVRVSKVCGCGTSIGTAGGSSTAAGLSLLSGSPKALTGCSSATAEGSESNFKKESDSKSMFSSS